MDLFIHDHCCANHRSSVTVKRYKSSCKYTLAIAGVSEREGEGEGEISTLQSTDDVFAQLVG